MKLLAISGLLGILAGCPQEDVEYLANDNLNGRAPGTQASVNAQNWLINKLKAVGARSLGNNYRQGYGSGTNIIGMLPATTPSNEYVIIGAHYDHLGNNCFSASGNDNICNGASDNAAGVATVLEIAEAMLREKRTRKRNLVLAFWDGEEAGLIGSNIYVNNPLVPLSRTVAYVNFDIMGSNLLPSLRWSTFLIGTESGGQNMSSHVLKAILKPNNPLEVRLMTVPFGEHRSDHASFLKKRIPSLFFTDAPTSCYHTAQDDANKIDYTKLQYQINIAKDLTIELLNTSRKPSFRSAQQSIYADAVNLSSLADSYIPDLWRFSSTQRQRMSSYRNQIVGIANRGPNAYNASSADQLGNAARGILTSIASLPCRSYIPAE